MIHKIKDYLKISSLKKVFNKIIFMIHKIKDYLKISSLKKVFNKIIFMIHKIKDYLKILISKIKVYKSKHPFKYGFIRICIKNILRYITVGYSTIVFAIYGLYKQIKNFRNSKQKLNLKSSSSSVIFIITGTVALGIIVYKKFIEVYYGLPELPEKSPEELKKEAKWAEWEDCKKELEEKKRDEEWSERKAKMDALEKEQEYKEALADAKVQVSVVTEALTNSLTVHEKLCADLNAIGMTSQDYTSRSKILLNQADKSLNDFGKIRTIEEGLYHIGEAKKALAKADEILNNKLALTYNCLEIVEEKTSEEAKINSLTYSLMVEERRVKAIEEGLKSSRPLDEVHDEILNDSIDIAKTHDQKLEEIQKDYIRITDGIKTIQTNIKSDKIDVIEKVGEQLDLSEKDLRKRASK